MKMRILSVIAAALLLGGLSVACGDERISDEESAWRDVMSARLSSPSADHKQV